MEVGIELMDLVVVTVGNINTTVAIDREIVEFRLFETDPDIAHSAPISAIKGKLLDPMMIPIDHHQELILLIIIPISGIDYRDGGGMVKLAQLKTLFPKSVEERISSIDQDLRSSGVGDIDPIPGIDCHIVGSIQTGDLTLITQLPIVILQNHHPIIAHIRNTDQAGWGGGDTHRVEESVLPLPFPSIDSNRLKSLVINNLTPTRVYRKDGELDIILMGGGIVLLDHLYRRHPLGIFNSKAGAEIETEIVAGGAIVAEAVSKRWLDQRGRIISGQNQEGDDHRL